MYNYQCNSMLFGNFSILVKASKKFKRIKNLQLTTKDLMANAQCQSKNVFLAFYAKS